MIRVPWLYHLFLVEIVLWKLATNISSHLMVDFFNNILAESRRKRFEASKLCWKWLWWLTGTIFESTARCRSTCRSPNQQRWWQSPLAIDRTDTGIYISQVYASNTIFIEHISHAQLISLFSQKVPIISIMYLYGLFESKLNVVSRIHSVLKAAAAIYWDSL